MPFGCWNMKVIYKKPENKWVFKETYVSSGNKSKFTQTNSIRARLLDDWALFDLKARMRHHGFGILILKNLIAALVVNTDKNINDRAAKQPSKHECGSNKWVKIFIVLGSHIMHHPNERNQEPDNHPTKVKLRRVFFFWKLLLNKFDHFINREALKI